MNIAIEWLAFVFPIWETLNLILIKEVEYS